jgi:hypothetical protein
MKFILMLFIFLLTICFAQTDLSTPGGQSVLITFTSEPVGAEIYVSDTFVGYTPISVRINANISTGYKAIIQQSAYEPYAAIIKTGQDSTINITLQAAPSKPINSSTSFTDLSPQGQGFAIYMFEKLGVIKIECPDLSFNAICGVTNITFDLLPQLWDMNASYTDFEVDPISSWELRDDGSLAKFYKLNDSEKILIGISENAFVVAALK